MTTHSTTATRNIARTQSQSDRAYETMKERLRRREYLPGEFLSENLLAQELGMSRTPVHEAVQRLAQEGVLSVIPKRGVMVSALSADDVKEIYAIREVLEGLAAGSAAAHSGERDVDRLYGILERAMNAGDGVEDLTKLDQEFHAEIARQSANGRLQLLLENMRDADLLQRFGHGAEMRRARYRTTSLTEHRAIVDAIAAGDSVVAAERMREHCRSAARFVAEYISSGFSRPQDVDATKAASI